MAEYLGMGLSAMLSVRRGAEAVEFYKAAFDAEVLFLHQDEASGEVVANLAIGPANLWLSDESIEYKNFSPETLKGTTVRLVLTVEDPHAAYEQAIEAGATAICPVRDEHSWLWASWSIHLATYGRSASRCGELLSSAAA